MPTVQSVGSLNYTDSVDGWTIPKPSGLAVGDLMVALLAIGEETATVTPPSGWTLIQANISVDDLGFHTYYKIADSGDAAASTFFFDSSDNSDEVGGCILRITGYDTASPINTSNKGQDTDIPSGDFSISAAITPSRANCLLIMGFAGRNTNVDIFDYFISTDNPTWTERHDSQTAASLDYSISVATASRPQVTSTGNIGADGVEGGGVMAGIIIAINPPQTTMTADVGEFDLTGQDATFSLLAFLITMTASVGSFILTGLQAFFRIGSSNVHNTPEKNIATITNRQKNISTVSNRSKNVANVTNLPKS